MSASPYDEIIIIIDEDGKINISVNGVKGSTCEELTKEIEKALGNVTERHKTEEYFQQSQNRTNRHIHKR